MKLKPEEQKRLEILEAERKRISEEIRKIKRKAYNRSYYTPTKNTKSIVFQTFGKSCKELNAEEKKKYNALRQAKRRLNNEKNT